MNIAPRTSIGQPIAKPDGLLLPFNKCRRWVNFQQIVRLESEGNYTQFFFADGSRLVVALTLKRLIARLPTGQFVRLHRKHIINRAFITGVRQSVHVVILASGDEISIARRRVSSLKREVRFTKN